MISRWKDEYENETITRIYLFRINSKMIYHSINFNSFVFLSSITCEFLRHYEIFIEDLWVPYFFRNL